MYKIIEDWNDKCYKKEKYDEKLVSLLIMDINLKLVLV